MQASGEKQPAKASGSGVRIAAVLLVVAAAVIYLILEFWNPSTEQPQAVFNETGFSLTYPFGSAFFHANGDGFFFADGDTLRFYSHGGELQMTQFVTVPNPEFYGRGAYAAAANRTARTVTVYDGSGVTYTANPTYHILNYSLNATGYMSLILQDGERYRFSALNPRGETVLTGDITHDRRIPVASDISADGSRLAVAFLDISGTQINFIVTVYRLDSTADGGTAAGNLLSSNSDNHGQMLGAMRFLDDGRLITVSDREIRSYHHNGAIAASVPVNNIISHISFSANLFAVITGESLLNTDGEPENTVIFYNSALNRRGVYTSAAPITRFTAGDAAALAASGRELTAITAGGNVIWTRIVTVDVAAALLLGDTHTVLLVNNTGAAIYAVERQ